LPITRVKRDDCCTEFLLLKEELYGYFGKAKTIKDLGPPIQYLYYGMQSFTITH